MADEVRSSDWSSDVWSSDLGGDKTAGYRDHQAGRAEASDGTNTTSIHGYAPSVGPRADCNRFRCAVPLPVAGVGRTPLVRCQDRKSVVLGKSVSVGVDLGGCRILKKQKYTNTATITS